MSISIISSPSPTILLSGNEAAYTISTSESYVRADVLIYAHTGQQLYSVSEQKSAVGGQVEFDLHAYVDAYLHSISTELDYDTLIANEYSYANSSVDVKFRFYNIDIQGNVLEAYVESEKQIVKGATEANTDYFVDYLNNYGAFLSFAPQPLYYSSQHGLFVSYYNREQRYLKVYAEFTFEGGATKTVTAIFAQFQKGVIHFHAQQTDMLAIAGSEFVQVRWWINNEANTAVSNVITFVPNLSNPRYERTLLVENGVGGLDGLMLLGKASDSSSFERTVAEHDEYERNIHVERRQELAISTGILVRQTDNLRLLQNWIVTEILAAKRAYLFTATALLEVRLLNDEETAYTDDEYMNSLTIKAQTSKILKSFTQPEIELPEAPSGDEGYYEEGYINNGYYGNY